MKKSKPDRFCYVMGYIILFLSSLSIGIGLLSFLIALAGTVPYTAAIAFISGGVGGLAISSVMLKLDEISILLAKIYDKD